MEAAERALAELASQAPEFLPAHLNLGLVRYEREDYVQAAAALSAALELDGEVAGARALLGHALLETGRLERAVQALEQALQEDAAAKNARFWLAKAFIGLGRFREAGAQIESLAAEAPGDPELLRLRILRAGSQSGRLRDRLLRESPASVAAKLTAAEVLAAAGERKEAIAAYREILRLQPTRRAVRSALGDLLFGQEDYAGAEALYRQEAELRPFAAKPWRRLGDVLLMQGESLAADQALSKALALEPGNSETLELLARAKSDQGRRDTAIELLRQAASAGAGPVARQRIHYQLAQLYRRTGQTAEAEAHAAEFQRLQGQNVPAGIESAAP